jgi:hypothetical protein
MLISLIVALIVVGVVLWGVNQLPIDATILRIINVLIVVTVVLWLVTRFFPRALSF